MSIVPTDVLKVMKTYCELGIVNNERLNVPHSFYKGELVSILGKLKTSKGYSFYLIGSEVDGPSNHIHIDLHVPVNNKNYEFTFGLPFDYIDFINCRNPEGLTIQSFIKLSWIFEGSVTVIDTSKTNSYFKDKLVNPNSI